ncbi:unnamed protein product [Acanthoscelides obtectus]|uniref:Uncharacterized protein n=1 Tax=Acanthoscelides obtectus TaxID=200917 RepID=A0A9P0M2N9_ACAOB|nr:unnamed protein product [Acanthoscelides obtectus]CAK1644943.1 hypothetical protein AOBTE_LOCUS13974 [Acanthoscelides obtectus]
MLVHGRNLQIFAELIVKTSYEILRKKSQAVKLGRKTGSNCNTATDAADPSAYSSTFGFQICILLIFIYLIIIVSPTTFLE